MNTKQFLVCFILLSTGLEVNAQYRTALTDFYYKKGLTSGRMKQRMSIGFGQHYVTGNVLLHYKAETDEGNNMETIVQRKITAKDAWAFHIGTYFPISLIGEKSMITSNVEFMLTGLLLSYKPTTFYNKQQEIAWAPSYMIGFPISIGYKTGGEVTLNKRDKTTFAFDVGVMPAIGNSVKYTAHPETLNYNNIIPYRLIPYVQVEAGVNVGIMMKLRVMGFLGKSTYMPSYRTWISGPGIYDQVETLPSGENGFNVTFVLLPFSRRWNDNNF